MCVVPEPAFTLVKASLKHPHVCRACQSFSAAREMAARDCGEASRYTVSSPLLLPKVAWIPSLHRLHCPWTSVAFGDVWLLHTWRYCGFLSRVFCPSWSYIAVRSPCLIGQRAGASSLKPAGGLPALPRCSGDRVAVGIMSARRGGPSGIAGSTV